jgi:hypothetical protein
MAQDKQEAESMRISSRSSSERLQSLCPPLHSRLLITDISVCTIKLGTLFVSTTSTAPPHAEK